MVYEALGRLEARGAALKTLEDKATLYRPVPPDTLLSRFEDETSRRVAELRARLAPLYNRQEEGRVWNFSGRKEALLYAADGAVRRIVRPLVHVAVPVMRGVTRGVALLLWPVTRLVSALASAGGRSS